MMSRPVRLIALAATAAVTWGAMPVGAQDASHAIMTTLDLATCRKVGRDGVAGKQWRCPGLPGFPVALAEVDDRTFLSVGGPAAKMRASRQTLRAPNTLFPGGTKRATIEWRVPHSAAGVNAAKPAASYAMIVRYVTAREAERGQVIVVSKVSAVENCQVALIDAEANADAMAAARTIADSIAKTFDCTKPPSVHGAIGKGPM